MYSHNIIKYGNGGKEMELIKRMIKKETVFVISFLLALISSFIVLPSEKYFNYIDFRVLAILLGLMLIMSAMKRIGIFDRICAFLLSKIKNSRQLVYVLVMLCFFSSMLITNDVALVAFVPFALYALKSSGVEHKAIFTVVMQTIAANLGSMLLPSGNPQNLYLYNLSEMGYVDFILLMLPYTILSFILLTVIIFIFCRKEPVTKIENKKSLPYKSSEKIKIMVYMLLFMVGIMTVCRFVPFWIFLAGTAVLIAVLDIKAFCGADYFLLLTFTCFFIFIGNIGSIQAVRDYLQSLVNGREVLAGVISSQFISNVPAALMLSGFTKNYSALIIGTDIGGLGTLIASMASLISYKSFCVSFDGKDGKNTKGRYLLMFSYYNVVFLICLAALYMITVK